MAKLVWDETGKRLYQTGLSKTVLYPQDDDGTYPKGEAWNGMSKITESPSGAEASPIYADDIKYLNLMSAEEYGGTIEAYTYPDGFEACDGSAELDTGITVGQQPRKAFGLAYKTKIGNDVKGDTYGYKLTIAYGCKAAPSSKDRQTVNENPEAMTMSWEFTSTPIDIPGMAKPSATIVFDSTKVPAKVMAAIEKVLYGSEEEDARLPLPAEIVQIATQAKA